MTSQTWADAIARETARLAAIGQLPDSLHTHSALRAMALLSVFATTKIRIRLVPNSVEARVAVTHPRQHNPSSHALLRHYETTITSPAKGETNADLPFRDWLDDHDYDGFIAATIGAAIADEARTALLRDVGGAIGRIAKTLRAAQRSHLQAVALRDVPAVGGKIHSVRPGRLRWLLAVSHDSRPGRPQILVRRMQALATYGAVAGILEDDAITATIDAGVPLAPLLMTRLDLSRAGVRALVGVRGAAEATAARTDWQPVLRALLDHEVPLHEWPGGGAPNQSAAWAASQWLHYAEPREAVSTLVRADYHGTDPAQVRDAVEAFRTDLLRPLLNERLRVYGRLNNYAASRLAHSMEGHWTTYAENISMTSTARRALLAVVRRALVGARHPKRFQEAATLWHRRAAAIAALRNERQSNRPGWPALCDAWQSTCGRYTIVPLTSAAALVAEGQAHEHCVGGYYEQCRRGDTQILSLRDCGTPAATIEVLLGSDWRTPHLTIGQFKSWHNTVPADPYHPVLRAFLADVRRGVHPIHARQLATYREWAHEYFSSSSEDALPLEHARHVYPLYRALLPRPAPESFDAWTEASGLAAGLDALIAHLFTTAEPQGTPAQALRQAA